MQRDGIDERCEDDVHDGEDDRDDEQAEDDIAEGQKDLVLRRLLGELTFLFYFHSTHSKSPFLKCPCRRSSS